MRIASTSLVGPGTIDLLEGALATVARAVDLCIVIPTSAEVDERDLKHAARRAGIRGSERLLFTGFEWCDDFAKARNFALDVAALNDCDWALTLDTDERIVSGRIGTADVDANELAERIASRPAGATVGMMMSADGTYSKERLFAVPTVERWRGRTHECFPWVHGQRWQIPGMSFREEPKSAGDYAAKLARDLRLLRIETELAPDESRWHYYVGQTLLGLERHREAVDAFLRCSRSTGWVEERAWACYRAAETECRAQRFDDAIAICTQGLAIHPGFSELPWLAAFCSFKLGRFEAAIQWAHMSIGTGIWKGCGRAFERTGFRHPPALFEGPFDVMAYAYDELGDLEQSTRARVQARYAMDFRLGKHEAEGDDE